MNVSGRAKVAEPEDVELEITIRASVADWRKLVEQVPRDYPSWKIASIITRAIGATVGRIETAHDLPDPNT